MSILRPRAPHPPPSVPLPAIARVQPMVPEVSLFLPPNTVAPTTRNPTIRPSTTRHPTPRPTPSELDSPSLAPAPAAPPPQQLLRPQSDFSRVFHSSEATIFLNGSDTGTFEVLERHVQFNSTDTVVTSNNSQTQGKIRFPHQVQPMVQAAPPKARAVVPARVPPSVSSPSNLPPAPKLSSPPSTLPPDLVQVLTWQNNHLAWQNDQLTKLQEQVAALLAASPVSTPPQPVPGQPCREESGSSPMLKRNIKETPTSRNTADTPASISNTTPKADMGTNTSTLWPGIQQAMERLRQDTEPASLCLEDLTTVQVPSRDSTSSPQPSLHIDLPPYLESGRRQDQDQPPFQESESRPNAHMDMPSYQERRPNMTSWSSPVLGESVSMYEEQQTIDNPAEVYQNILGQVKRLLAEDFPQGQVQGQTGEHYQQDGLDHHQEATQDIRPAPNYNNNQYTNTTPQHINTAPKYTNVPQNINSAPHITTNIPQFTNTAALQNANNAAPQNTNTAPRQTNTAPQYPYSPPQNTYPTTDITTTPQYNRIAPQSSESQTQSSTTPLDHATATVERLRQMGVSFISPADLSPAAANHSQPPYNSVYLPQARLPSMLASPDTSLDINSLALKYLDDKQLGQLAERHTRQQEKKQVSWGEETKGDRGVADYSMATQQFLTRHGHNGVQNTQHQSNRLATRSDPVVGGIRQPQHVKGNQRVQQQAHDQQPVVGPTRGVFQPHQSDNNQPLFPRQPQAVQPNRATADHFPQPQFRQQPPVLTGHQFQFPASNDRVFPEPLQLPVRPPNNLQNNHAVCKPSQQPPTINRQLANNQPASFSNRVLDITAIKQQPKLL